MAANDADFVQKHVEKLVLGVCTLALLFSVFHYGVGTPRRIEVGSGEPVPPGDVDAMILEEAERVDRRIRGYTPKTESVPDFAADLLAMQAEPIDGVELVGSMVGTPKAEGIPGVSEQSIELPTLADVKDAMPTPRQPRSWIGEELVTRGEDDPLSEEAVWRAGTLYDFAALREAWAGALRNTIIAPDVVCVGYDLDIQLRNPDGTWAPAADVVPVRSEAMIHNVPPMPVYDPEAANADEVAARIEQLTSALASPKWTVYLLQPTWWPILSEEDSNWHVHFPTELYEEFDDRQRAAAEAAADAAPRQPTGAAMPGMPGGPGLPDRPVPPTRRPTRTQPVMPPEMMPGGMPGGMPGMEPTRPTAPAGDGEAMFDVTTMPTTQEQQALGVWLAWFHTNRIEYNREYRCRMRLKFINPLLANPQEVNPENKADATVPFVATDWSPWSEPVALDQQREFYVTGANEAAGTITVDIFATTLNQRVRRRFSGIAPGTMIGHEADVEVINPVDGQTIRRAVDFSTGAIALQFDFRKRITTAAGIERSDTDMVFLSRNGTLERRSKYLDENSQAYQALKKQAEMTAGGVEPEAPEQPDRDAPRRRRPAGGRPNVPPDWIPPDYR
ncbi:MAG: hypothetical protein GVY16_11475 [Planctomycetes bacterium]|jgi:hypothetical protein|nr:hypothetical protein [Planctomycetota bacterium]